MQYLLTSSQDSSSPASLAMSSYSPLLSPNSPENDQSDEMLVEIADYLNFTELLHEGSTSMLPPRQHYPFPPKTDTDHVDRSGTGCGSNSRNLVSETLRGSGSKVAFKTKSEIEVLNDGYKWRKYGKKMVKNSPNPRNYYRCSSEGCNVKKRVEREPDESSYVITTYQGVHNHQAPSPVTSSSSST